MLDGWADDEEVMDVEDEEMGAEDEGGADDVDEAVEDTVTDADADGPEVSTLDILGVRSVGD
jgi:hypothetical protein